MKKRLLSLLILLFMVVSFLLPFSSTESTQNEETTVIEPKIMSTITYEIEVEEVFEEADPYERVIAEMQEKMYEIESIEDRKEWFLSYKDIVFKYAKWIDPPETIYDCFTEDEVKLICRVVETETYQCDFNSKVNVANVVLNRIESGEFGDTVEEVITTENQFAYGREVITEDTILAVMYAYEVIDTTGGCIAFRSGDNLPYKWYDWELVFVDNAGHGFYK